ncbi:unnamed protein product, partial [Arabidopsis halleri]
MEKGARELKTHNLSLFSLCQTPLKTHQYQLRNFSRQTGKKRERDFLES